MPLPGYRLTWTAYAEAYPFLAYKGWRRKRLSLLSSRETAAVTFAPTLLPPGDALSSAQGALVLRGTLPSPGNGTIWRWYVDANNFMRLRRLSSTTYTFERMVAGVSATASVVTPVVAGAEVTWACTWTQTGIGLSVNGAAPVTTASGWGDLTGSIEVGTAANADASGLTPLWLVLMSGTPSTEDIALMAAWDADEFGDYPPGLDPLSDLSGEAGPMAFWGGGEATLYRTLVPAWDELFTVTDAAVTHYTDRFTASGQEYDYAVTVQADVYGATLESPRQDPPLTDSVRHTGTVIQNIYDLTDAVVVNAPTYRVTPELEAAYVEVGGRQAPTAEFGEHEAATIVVDVGARSMLDPTEAEALRRMLTAQRERGAVFCVRPGAFPEIHYVNFPSFDRTAAQTLIRIGSLEMREVHVDGMPS